MLLFALVAFLAFSLLCVWYLAWPSCGAMTWSVFLLLLCFVLAHVDIPLGLVDVIPLEMTSNIGRIS
jgi:hypothetical protein